MVAGARGLVPGKFGNALRLPVGEGAGVSWPRNDYLFFGAAPMSDRGNAIPESFNLGYLDFTLEFWFRASGAQAGRGVVWELRNEETDQEKCMPIRLTPKAAVEPRRVVGAGRTWHHR